MDLDTRGRGGGGSGSNSMAGNCAQRFLQIRSTECLNVCEWMNVIERIAIVSTFDLMSLNSSVLVKKTLEKILLILTTVTTFTFHSFVL